MILINDNHNLLPRSVGNMKLNNIFRKPNLGKVFRIFRKIHLNSIFPLKRLWFSSWVKYLKNEKYVIIFDFGSADLVIKYIRKINKNLRIIFWYWNPIDISISINKIKELDCEIWSFDLGDVEKYSLKYNTQFFCYENLERLKPVDNLKAFDVFFCGTEKNRIKDLLIIEEEFKKYKVSYYFHIVKSSGYYKSTEGYDYKLPLEYGQYLYLIFKSKCVFDFVSSEQNGITLRPLEALFFKKKLITNQKSIMNMDLYNRNNIFILGVDDYSKLNDFINSDYDYTNQSYLETKYCFESWLNRFFK